MSGVELMMNERHRYTGLGLLSAGLCQYESLIATGRPVPPACSQLPAHHHAAAAAAAWFTPPSASTVASPASQLSHVCRYAMRHVSCVVLCHGCFSGLSFDVSTYRRSYALRLSSFKFINL